MTTIRYFSLILLLFVTNATAWYRIEKYYSPDNPGKCTYNDELVLSPGETADYPKEKCAIITCNNAEGSLALQGCGVYGPPANCKLGEPVYKDAPYPKCCQPKIICNEIESDIPLLD